MVKQWQKPTYQLDEGPFLRVCVCVCVRARARVRTPLAHRGRGSPDLQRLFILQGRAAPSNEALPCTLGKGTCVGLSLGVVPGSWQDPHFRSSFISVRATSFFCVWRSMGQKPYP